LKLSHLGIALNEVVFSLRIGRLTGDPQPVRKHTNTAAPPPPPVTVNVTVNNFNIGHGNGNPRMEAARQLERFVDTIDQSILYFEAPLVSSMQGQLVIVGSGIRAISDMTLDAEAQVRVAQKVLYCVGDPVTERKLHTLNPSAESLYGLYGNGKPRMDTYREMLEAILSPLRAGLRVCVVYYGYPGVFAWSTHQAVRLARREGYRAEMHAGISADARYLRILASTRRRRVVTRLRQRIFSSGAENRTSLRMSCFGKWNA
jgi:Tetrapyrrole (Corrin/Porphyrin) Methylases